MPAGNENLDGAFHLIKEHGKDNQSIGEEDFIQMGKGGSSNQKVAEDEQGSEDHRLGSNEVKQLVRSVDFQSFEGQFFEIQGITMDIRVQQ